MKKMCFKRLKDRGEHVWEKALDLIFPPRCPLCSQICRNKNGICPECRKKIKYIKEPRCLKCGKQLELEDQEYCKDCKERKRFFVQGRALYEYESVAGALYRFKYKGKKEYGKIFGEEMAFFMADYIRSIRPDALVPVPMYPTKKRIRGYNQAQVLAESLGKHLDIPVKTNLVRRIRNTKALKSLNSKERLNNLKNAFILEGNGVKLSTIVIVDDIYTTGSTIDSVAKVFLEAGVKRVYFLTLAVGEGC